MNNRNQLLIDALHGTPRDLTRLLKRVDDGSALMRSSPDAWCIKDVVAHLNYIEPLYLARLKRIVEQDNPYESYLHPDASAHGLTRPLNELIADFTAKRTETIAFLSSLTHQQWLRTCTHETYGLTKLRRQVEILIGHDNNHLAQIVEIREYLEKHIMTNRFLKLLQQNGPIMADGAMGTQLMAAGLLFGDPPELWNLLPDKRDKVRAVYRGYLNAGSDIILTNTFGGNPFRLKMHNLQDRVFELNKAGADLAREEAGDRVVAADIGPSGEIFEPMGTLRYENAVEGFRKQAEGLAAGGVDVFWVETMSDLREVQAAVEGARKAAPEIPIVTTMTFDTRGFTMMGVSPADAINELAILDVAAIGGNCGNGPDELEAVIYAMSMVQSAKRIPLVAKSNAGMPKMVNGKAVYDATPELMAEAARRFRAFGATIIGACCGSTPAHIRAMKEALLNQPPLDPSTLTLTVPLARKNAISDEARRDRRSRRESANTRESSLIS